VEQGGTVVPQGLTASGGLRVQAPSEHSSQADAHTNQELQDSFLLNPELNPRGGPVSFSSSS